MAAPLELDLRQRPAAHGSASRDVRIGVSLRTRAAGLVRALLQWTPVWVPLVFLAQLLLLGLRPTLAEGARLEQAETEVRARAAALRAEERELSEQARMLSDEVFRERVRRSLVDPKAAPLTLERARAGRQP
jgi:cell division protein FtsB